MAISLAPSSLPPQKPPNPPPLRLSLTWSGGCACQLRGGRLEQPRQTPVSGLRNWLDVGVLTLGARLQACDSVLATLVDTSLGTWLVELVARGSGTGTGGGARCVARS